MAVGFSNTNKPINPRGQDASPLAFNRAKLYSGKALDFDGVNDNVEVADNSSLDFTTAMSAFCYMRVDTLSTGGGVEYAISKYDYGNNNRSWLLGQRDNELIAVISKNGFSGATNTKDRFSATFENTNDYYFVGFTFESNTLKLYVNGQEVTTSSSNDAEVNSIYSGSADVCVGSGQFNGSGIGFLDGKVANARVFNQVLTAAQVADLYNNPEKVVPTGVDNTALKLWLPMMEGAGTTAYDGSAPLTDYVTNGDFSDGTNNWTASNATLSVEGGALKITSTGGNRPQGYQTITGLIVGRKYLLSAVARVGTTSYNMEIEISGIGASGSYNKTTNSTDTYIYTEFTATSTTHVVQAKIDDSAVGVGETGYFDDIKLLDLGNYGTINGATWVQGVGAPVAQSAVIDWNKMVPDHTNEILVPQGLTAGRDLLGNLFENVRKQGALNLDGNSWAEVHDNASLDITSAITLEAWYYHTGSGTKIIQGRWSTQVDNSYLMYVEGNKIKFVGNDGSSTFGGNASTTDLSLDQFNHVVITYDRTNLKYYLNGVLIDTFAYTVSLNPNATVALDIGRNDGISGVYTGANYNNTPIAQPRIYNRALTVAEVLRNYNSGKNTYK